MARLLVALVLAVPSFRGMGAYTPENAACAKFTKEWNEKYMAWLKIEFCPVAFIAPQPPSLRYSCSATTQPSVALTKTFEESARKCTQEQDCDDLSKVQKEGKLMFEFTPWCDGNEKCTCTECGAGFQETINGCLGSPPAR